MRSHYGNVARFLNHSCQPNVEKVTVFSDSQDVRVPRYCSKYLNTAILIMAKILFFNVLEWPYFRTNLFLRVLNYATIMAISKEMLKESIGNVFVELKNVVEICIRNCHLTCLQEEEFIRFTFF